MKKGKVLFITPNLKGMKKGVNRIQPPLGPMIMASAVKEQGHEVYIHDTALEGWNNKLEINKNTVITGQSDDEIKGVIDNYNPDIVAISALFSNLMESAHNIARLSKSVNPKAKVILGGNHISNAASDYLYSLTDPNSGLPQTIKDLEDRNIDYAMRGEVDLTFPYLVDALLNNKDVSNIPGIVMRKNNSSNLEFLVNTPPRIADLSILPKPARELVNMEGYFDIGAFHSPKSKSKRVLSIMASRGCPEKCTFCTTPEMWGAKVRWRPIEDIMQEIKQDTKEYNIGEIQFEDDTLTANSPRLLELCNGLEKVGLPWCTPNGTKTNYHLASQPELYKSMADSGCYQITLACESGVQRVLDDVIRKNLKIEQIKPAIENAKNAGMMVHTFWVLGYPGESYEEIQRSVEFAEQSGADSYSFAILNPLPGTPIYRQVVKENLWWPNRDLRDLMYRSSLVKVNGFKSPEEFESYVDQTSLKLNKLLSEKDPERFERQYGKNTDNKDMLRQT
jgi:anaerobic magnesium-protoporphyrin IX monomethyl ester cyclase